MDAGVNVSRVMELPHSTSSVAVARDSLAAELTERGASVATLEDASLVISELVGNALRHARPLPSGQLRLSWQLQNHHVEIAVSDGGSPTTPTRGNLTLSSAGGRGLGIVDHVARAWGVHRASDVTTVWAIVPTRTLASTPS